MKIDFCFLADAVAAPVDGKFYVHGGGITRIDATQFPFAVPQLAIAVRLVLDEDETHVGHTYGFAFIDAGGLSIARLEYPAPPPETVRPLAEGEDRFAIIVANVSGLTFPHGGPYHLEFRVDGELLTTTSLAVVGPEPSAEISSGV